MQAVTEETPGGESFAVVEFGTNANTVVGMTSHNEALQELNGLVYTGGYTNHAEAISHCQATFDTYSGSNRENVILLVTDGVATRPGKDPFGAATAAADSAKEAGTTILPVFIQPLATVTAFSANAVEAAAIAQQELNYMIGLSSEGMVTDVTNFEELSSLIDGLVPQIACRTSIPSSAPSSDEPTVSIYILL